MATKTAKAKIEVILPDMTAKKNSVRFETGERPAAVTNIYLSREGLMQLGNPEAIKITIEAHDPEA